MKIEILYPEMAYLFGDNANVLYLEKSLPEAEFIKTQFSQIPFLHYFHCASRWSVDVSIESCNQITPKNL